MHAVFMGMPTALAILSAAHQHATSHDAGSLPGILNPES